MSWQLAPAWNKGLKDAFSEGGDYSNRKERLYFVEHFHRTSFKKVVK